VAHYTFDKDATDSSGRGNHATANGPKAVPDGKLGGAFAFNGTGDHVAVPSKVTAGLTWFTIALWFKTTQAAASPRSRFWSNPGLVSASTGGYASNDLGLMLEGGKPAYFHGLYGRSTDMAWFSDAAAADDKWHHVALVGEGPRVLLYLDGRLLRGTVLGITSNGVRYLGQQAQTAAGDALGDVALFIGACHEGGANYCFRGLIDDVRIWKRALSAKEVAALAGGK